MVGGCTGRPHVARARKSLVAVARDDLNGWKIRANERDRIVRASVVDDDDLDAVNVLRRH